MKTMFQGPTGPIDPEPQMAFHLLCEARRECGDQRSKTFEGITIHAPEGLEQWLAPFSPSEDDDDDEKIAAVATLMGVTLEAKAKDVLNAVKKTPPDNDGVLCAINAFLLGDGNATSQSST